MLWLAAARLPQFKGANPKLMICAAFVQISLTVALLTLVISVKALLSNEIYKIKVNFSATTMTATATTTT